MDLRKRAVSISQVESSPPKAKISATHRCERVALHRQWQKEKDGYNAEEERKKETENCPDTGKKEEMPSRKCTDKTSRACFIHFKAGIWEGIK